MAAINTNDIEKQVVHLAATIFTEFSQRAISDGKAFLADAQQELVQATQEHARGEITEAEYQEALRDLRAEAKMEKLKQEGLAQVSIDRFTAGIIDIVTKAALAAIP
jgi:DNA-binding transcriptional regulator GbsR (MarR family)